MWREGAALSASINSRGESQRQRGRFNSEATSISPQSLPGTEGEEEEEDDMMLEGNDGQRGQAATRRGGIPGEHDSKVFTVVWWMLYPMFLIFFVLAGEILPAMQEGVLRAARVFLRRGNDKLGVDELLIEDEDEDEDTDGVDTAATTPNTPAGSSSCRSPATRHR